MRPSAVFAVLALTLGFGVASCGDEDEEQCPGRICTSCAGSGDCDITCPEGQIEHCVGLEFFGQENPDDLRCAYCGE